MEIIRRSVNFFFDLVQKTFQRQHLPKNIEVELYLAELLEYFSEDRQQILSEPLRKKFWEIIQENDQARFIEIKEIGDASLFTAGILVPNMSRPILTSQYYMEVAEIAYRFLFFNNKKDPSPVYGQLSKNLIPLVRVLKQIGREHIFKVSLEDIVRVCERYMLRGAEEDRQWLLEHGITILSGPPDKKIIVS